MKATAALLAVALAALFLASPAHAEEKKPAAEAASAKAKNVTAEEAEKLIKENPGITILDVRSPEEFAEGHIKGAVNINVHDSEFEKQVAKLDQSKPVIVHCQAGRRSAEALTEMGSKVKFPKIYHLNSGFKGWKDAGKPVAKGQ